MEYTLDIYARQPEQLMAMMARNCRNRRIERGIAEGRLQKRQECQLRLSKGLRGRERFPLNPSVPLSWSLITLGRCLRFSQSLSIVQAVNWKQLTGTRIE